MNDNLCEWKRNTCDVGQTKPKVFADLLMVSFYKNAGNTGWLRRYLKLNVF